MPPCASVQPSRKQADCRKRPPACVARAGTRRARPSAHYSDFNTPVAWFFSHAGAVRSNADRAAADALASLPGTARRSGFLDLTTSCPSRALHRGRPDRFQARFKSSHLAFDQRRLNYRKLYLTAQLRSPTSALAALRCHTTQLRHARPRTRHRNRSHWRTCVMSASTATLRSQP